MKKKICVIAMAMSLTVAIFAGCGNQNQESSETETSAVRTVTVSAAASLTDVLNELAEAFQAEHPDADISFTFGGSGALQAQIEEGAPVDLFFSAAESNMDALEEQGLIDADTRKDVLENEIVLIAPQGETKVTSFENILDSAPTIALGEAESVPAGKYAQEIFTNLGIWEEVASHAVYASNVREVLTWVESAEADCGVVYATDAKTSDAVQVICGAPEGGPQVLYPAAVIADCANPEGAKAFLDFLTSEEAGEVFASYGFSFLA